MWAFDRHATRDTWGPRFDFKKNPPNALYPDNCTLLVQPVLSVDNGTQLQLRLRGYNLTHNIEFFVPRVSIHVKRALRQPPLALPSALVAFASNTKQQRYGIFSACRALLGVLLQRQPVRRQNSRRCATHLMIAVADAALPLAL